MVVDAADVDVYTRDGDSDPATFDHSPVVASVDARHSQLTLDAAPATGRTLHLDGYLLPRPWNMELARAAVSALAAHYLDRAKQRPGEYALSGLERGSSVTIETSSWRKEYETIVGKVLGGERDLAFGTASKDPTSSSRRSEVLDR